MKDIYEASTLIGVSHNTIRNWLDQDYIECIRLNERGDIRLTEETVELLSFMKKKFGSTQQVTTGLRLMSEEADTKADVMQLFIEAEGN